MFSSQTTIWLFPMIRSFPFARSFIIEAILKNTPTEASVLLVKRRIFSKEV